MCGIFGVYSLSENPDPARFEKALHRLDHRGPDFSRAMQLDDHTILGHTRLSIIDLSSSNHQPFCVDDRYSMTYNGEVYNYIEIRTELKSLGIEFLTHGDTEVILRAYIFWGENCVSKFNGMWAFAIYDRYLQKLFCSRDRFGVKPFVYYRTADEFIFASEIKAIIEYKPEIKAPNYNMIANYCQKSIGGQAEETWFKDVVRLLPAHNLVVEKKDFRNYRYWDYPQNIDRHITFKEASEAFRNIFIDAVKIRMRSDVPVGSTLSSGLDSTSIVGVIDKLKLGKIDTFTAYSPKAAFTLNDKQAYQDTVDLDESEIVKNLVTQFDVNPSLLEVSFDDYVGKLSEAIYYLESGHSSPAIICIHQVYKEARKKVKVLLEGQGADELCGGYIVDNFFQYLLQNIKAGEVIESLRHFNQFRSIYSLKYLLLLTLRRYDSSFLNNVKNLVNAIDIFNDNAFSYKYIKDTIDHKVFFDDALNKQLYNQHTSGLVNLLHYGDALSMSESIECRLPFMDYRLVEFVFRLPYNFKINGMHGKYIQRKALSSFIPDFIENSNVKIGFATPLDSLMQNSKVIEDVLLNQKCGILFNDEKVKRLLMQHRAGKRNHSTLLFRILSAKLWYKAFFRD